MRPARDASTIYLSMRLRRYVAGKWRDRRGRGPGDYFGRRVVSRPADAPSTRLSYSILPIQPLSLVDAPKESRGASWHGVKSIALEAIYPGVVFASGTVEIEPRERVRGFGCASARVRNRCRSNQLGNVYVAGILYPSDIRRTRARGPCRGGAFVVRDNRLLRTRESSGRSRAARRRH